MEEPISLLIFPLPLEDQKSCSYQLTLYFFYYSVKLQDFFVFFPLYEEDAAVFTGVLHSSHTSC